MKIDAYSILVLFSILVVLSYLFNYLSGKLHIPSVLLLILSGIGLRLLGDEFEILLPQSRITLEILGVSGLILIVLEASLELKITREKLRLIGLALLSAFALLGITALITALIFKSYYGAGFRQAMLHAIPLSVISSAIAIPSVSSLEDQRREFVVYESTFSDILGILAFNYFLVDHSTGLGAIAGFSWDLVLIVVISVLSTVLLVFLLNHSMSHVRFFLTFAVIVLVYSLAKYFHLPSLILVLCFGLVLNNFNSFGFPIVHRFISFGKLADVAKELKVMTTETAFIIRTFFFLLFGYTINLALITTQEVLVTGFGFILLTIILRFIFIHYFLKIRSTPLSLIAPRGLITILLFNSIPVTDRIESLSEGVLFVVIGLTSIVMTIGLLISHAQAKEKIEDTI